MGCCHFVVLVIIFKMLKDNRFEEKGVFGREMFVTRMRRSNLDALVTGITLN